MSRKQRPPPARPGRSGAARRPAAARPAPSAAALAAVDAPLNEAITHHRAGRFTAAESLYRQVLAAVPQHGDARHLLGMVLMQQGDHAGAEDAIRQALADDPGFASAWNSLGNVLRTRGAREPEVLEEAVTAFRKAVSLRADDPEAWSNLGATLHNLGRHAEAAAACRDALTHDPEWVDAHYNLGFAARALGDTATAEACFRRVLARVPWQHGRLGAESLYHLGLLLQQRGASGDPAALEEAEACFRHLCDLRPELAEAHQGLGDTLYLSGRLEPASVAYRDSLARRPEHAETLNNLAVAQHGLGHPDAAATILRQALAQNPDYADAYANLGRALIDLDRLAEAAACLRQALDLRPDMAEAHSNLGIVLKEQGRLTEAATCHMRALTLRPTYADALANLGVVRQEQGRLDEAAACQRRALHLQPKHARALSNLGTVLQAWGQREAAELCYQSALAEDPRLPLAHWNLALMWLGRGDLEAGWPAYSWRFAARQAKPWRHPPAREWQGEDLTGQRILVWREQGVGDELMFASCLPDLIARAGHVTLECDRRLVPLLARSLPQATVRAESLDDLGNETIQPGMFDYHTPAGSLPRWLRPDLAAFPFRSSYLMADPKRVQEWRHRLIGLEGNLKVGLCWRSRLLTGGRSEAYTGLSRWAPLFSQPGVSFIRLQYDDCEVEIRDAERRFGITIHRWPGLDLMNDFDGVAALMSALDLVIAGPTSVGELAGALGVPVWRFAWNGDWTALGSDRRPWFPSMRLFYARAGERLDDMLELMAGDLRDLAQPPSPPPYTLAYRPRVR